MILLDTHAWIWWLSEPSRLSTRARNAIDECMVDQSIQVSSISIWETGLLVRKGRLELGEDVQTWVARAESLPFLRYLPVDNAIALQSTRLPDSFHADPADRIIVATALRFQCPVVSKDHRMRDFSPIKAIW